MQGGMCGALLSSTRITSGCRSEWLCTWASHAGPKRPEPAGPWPARCSHEGLRLAGSLTCQARGRSSAEHSSLAVGMLQQQLHHGRACAPDKGGQLLPLHAAELWPCPACSSPVCSHRCPAGAGGQPSVADSLTASYRAFRRRLRLLQ